MVTKQRFYITLYPCPSSLPCPPPLAPTLHYLTKLHIYPLLPRQDHITPPPPCRHGPTLLYKASHFYIVFLRNKQWNSCRSTKRFELRIESTTSGMQTQKCLGGQLHPTGVKKCGHSPAALQGPTRRPQRPMGR